MPFADHEIRADTPCGIGRDGRWHRWCHISVPATALRHLGLHPDQPPARPAGDSPPAWWHAEAERRARRP
ncbi:hypothetical protein [Streptomyces sp. NPDC047928]|uniref:hypothetical protein n=1 Tax=unclassified Streptomyces TaxID=2593676 RepID=UPI00371549E8